METQTKILDKAKRITEIIFIGRIDILSREEAKAVLLNTLSTTASTVVINLQQVPLIDSSGLSALVSGLRTAREKDKNIVLVGLNKQAEMVFRLTMMDQVFVIFPSIEEALQAL